MKILAVVTMILLLSSAGSVYSQTEIEMKVWSLLDTGKIESAMDIMDDLGTMSNILKLSKARAYYMMKRYDKSIDMLNDLVENAGLNDSDLLEATTKSLCLLYLGKNYVAKGDIAKGKSLIRRALSLKQMEFAYDLAAKELAELGDNYGLQAREKLLRGIGLKAPDFELEDAWGKKYRLQDFLGKPVVLHLGTTWCGSCQMDAEDLERFHEYYSRKGVVFLKILCGESPNTVIDYKNHYRSEILNLIDYDHALHSIYGMGRYAVTVVIDDSGKVVFNANDIQYHGLRSKEAYGLVDDILSKHSTRTIEPQGIVRQKRRNSGGLLRESGAKAAVDKEGNIWVVYASNRDGNNNIYLRRYRNSKIVQEYTITEKDGDDYSPDIALSADQTIWISWISDRDGRYNVYVRKLEDGRLSKAKRVTDAFDDAFHPCIDVDGDDRLHLSYYKWDTIDIDMGKVKSFSRDRDVYYRRCDGGKWKNEIRVSPEQHRWDDHVDPVILCDDKDTAYIAWSYDYHPQHYENPRKASNPSIFMQRIANYRLVGDPILIGTLEVEEGNVIDITPSIAIGRKQSVWCAWNVILGGAREIRATKVTSKQKLAERISDIGAVCIEPSIAIDSSGSPMIVWSQQVDKKWQLRYSKRLNDSWAKPLQILNSEGDCHNPTLVTAVAGRTYVLFNETHEGRSKVKLIEISKELSD